MTTPNHLKFWIALVILAVGPTVNRPPQVPTQRPAASPTTIPADITSYGGILLQAQINNSRPMWFYLDSGASYPFVIEVRRAKGLGLKLEGHGVRGGGAGPNAYEFAETRGVSISIDGLTFKDRSAAVMGLSLIDEQLGRPTDGLVGIELFLRYVVEIDYSAKKIRLYDPEKYNYSGRGESIALELRDGHFFVPAKVEMPGRPALTGQYVVDTGGCLMTAVLTTPFAESNHLPAPSQRTILDRSVSGLGGETKLLISRATSFTLGSSVIRGPLIYVSQDKGGALASTQYDGLIGSEILRKFKAIFDHTRHRLILERNDQYAAPIEYDMSGISFRAYGNDLRTFRAYQVLEDSPAGEAGLRVGDELLSIDDVAASQLTLEQIMQMLKVPGREYKLTLKRSSEMLSVKIKTRRLL